MSQYRSKALSSIAVGLLIAGSAMPVMAGGTIKIDDTKSISVGAGIRTAFMVTEDGAPNGGSEGKDFDVLNSRLYISGQVTEEWKFTLNFEEIWGEYGVLDAMIQYELNEYFNVWAGRVLTPADRIEMNGPFYGLSWGQYTVPLYPSDNDPTEPFAAGAYGRDDGFVIWGDANKFQYAFGIFDGLNSPANHSDSLLYSARFAYNFLNKEQNPGYYTSSTYYGGLGDIFTLGLSGQFQENGAGDTAADGETFSGYAVDMLFEKVLGGSVLTLEGEYKDFDTDYVSTGSPTEFVMFDGEAMFVTAAYLFPGGEGPGRYQPYIRYTENNPEMGKVSDLSEVGLNYVIDGHNLRLNVNVTNGDAGASGQAAADDAHTVSFGIQYQI